VWRLVGALYASPQRSSVTMWDDVSGRGRRLSLVFADVARLGVERRGGEGWSCRDCVCRAAQCLLRCFLVLGKTSS